MKTTDLIPIILYQLVDGDRYGYEIIKQIEDVSNGNIVIKQPSLYSVLKKLEQGRFISSYWQDSEIGGKRHYYKLTDNGRAQLGTYPPLSTLINDILAEDGITLTPSIQNQQTQTTVEQTPSLSAEVNDDKKIESAELNTEFNDTISPIDDINEIKPIKIDLTSPTISKDDNFDDIPHKNEVQIDLASPTESVETHINVFDAIEEPKPKTESIFDAIEPRVRQSTSIFDAVEESKPSADKNIFDVVENTTTKAASVEKIYDEKVEKNIKTPTISKEETAKISSSSLEVKLPTQTVKIEQIPFINYVDFETDETTVSRRNAVKKHIEKMIFTTTSLLLLIALSIVLCSKYSFGKLYYISAIISGIIILLYPTLLLKNISKIRLKYCDEPFKYYKSREKFIKLTIFLALIICIFAYNLTCVNMVKDIFILSNFGNFYAPIMLSSIVMIDFVFGLLLYKNYAVSKK